MPSSTSAAPGAGPPAPLRAVTAAEACAEALRLRSRGNAVEAAAAWARLEDAARAAGRPRLAVQAGAARALALTLGGSPSAAGLLCDELIVELTALERAGAPRERPPLALRRLHGRGAAWWSVAGLRRLRAEQLRRAGDSAGALEALDEARREPRGRRAADLPEWGRAILSDALRLAGDAEGALAVAEGAERAARRPGAHPWTLLAAERATARALLALGELGEAGRRFAAIAGAPAHRRADAGVGGQLGLGEAARRRGRLATAAASFAAARAAAARAGDSVGWISAQLCLADLARQRGASRAEVADVVAPVRTRLALAEHPFLAVRAHVLAALTAEGATAEAWLDRAEDQLPRFQRRSGDLELERELVELCRHAVVAGEPAPPIAMDFL